jgi:hypothetical protein
MTKKELLHLAKWAGYIALAVVVIQYLFGSSFPKLTSASSPLNITTALNVV